MARKVIAHGEDPDEFHKQIVALSLDNPTLAAYLDAAHASGVTVVPVITVDQELALEHSRAFVPKGLPEREAI